jgi:hypothetical protein
VPGKFVVLVRGDAQTPWSVAGAALTAAEAQDVVTSVAALNARARIVVLQAVRSFVVTAAPAEDPVVTVDP